MCCFAAQVSRIRAALLYGGAAHNRGGRDAISSKYRTLTFTPESFFLPVVKERISCSLQGQVWQSGDSVSIQQYVLWRPVFRYRTRMLSHTWRRPVWGREALLSRGLRVWSGLFKIRVFLSKDAMNDALEKAVVCQVSCLTCQNDHNF